MQIFNFRKITLKPELKITFNSIIFPVIFSFPRARYSQLLKVGIQQILKDISRIPIQLLVPPLMKTFHMVQFPECILLI